MSLSLPDLQLLLYMSPARLAGQTQVCQSQHIYSDLTVRLLLLHPQINDTIRDEQGRTPLECSADAEVSSSIEGMSTANSEADPRLPHGPPAEVQGLARELYRKSPQLAGREQRDDLFLARTQVSASRLSPGITNRSGLIS